MILKPWKRLLYLLFFAALLYFLFPTNTEMVLLHLEGDDPVKGERFLTEALVRQPDDFDLRVLSAELHWAHDRVEPALEDLRVALKLKSANMRALILNATYLEWALRMDEAYPAWEKVAQRDAKRPELHLKLASMASAMGDSHGAGKHAALWIKALGPPPRETVAIPYFGAAWRLLSRLGEEAVAGAADELKSDVLYLLAASYSRSLEQFAGGSRDFSGDSTGLLRACVLAGLVDDASMTALDLDLGSGGLEARGTLLSLMERVGMSARAEEALLAMVRQAPDQEETLLALLDMGSDQGMDDARTLALERLSRVNPDEERYRSLLIARYVDAGRYDRISELMDRLAWFTGSGIRYARQVVAAAFISGDRGFMARVSDESDKITTRDPEIISSRARLALALRDYRKGAELAQVLAELAPSETVEVLKKVLAGGDYDAEAMGDALAVALSLTPEDTQLVKASAVNSRARGHAEAAFSLMRRCLLITRHREDFSLLTEMARETADSRVSLSEVCRLGERVFGKDPRFLRVVVGIRQELDDPVGAYEAQLELARLFPDPEETARLLELAGYTGRSEDSRQALDFALRVHPGDPGLIRMSVELALADSDLARAEAALNELLRFAPSDVDALRKLANVASWTGRPELEGRILVRLKELGAASRQDHIRLAQSLESSGAGPRALETVLELLGANGQDGELLRLGMQFALWNGRPETAAVLGERLCGLPGGETFQVRTGGAWLAASEPAKAAPWLEKARLGGRGGEETLRLLVQAYLELNRFASILEIARELEARGRLTQAETLAVASAEAALGRWGAVLERLGPLRGEPSLDAEGELLVCRALERTGARDEAVKLMQSFADRHGKDASLLVRAGELAFAAGRYDLAGSIYRKALSVKPGHTVAMRGLASVLAEEGRTSQAARLMDVHNQASPADADSRIQAAELHAALGNEAKARRDYKKALRLLNKPAGEVN